MTKQQSLALADSIRANRRHHTVEGILSLASFCASQSPTFNPIPWIEYIVGDCAPKEGKRKV